MNTPEIKACLTHLAVHALVSAATRNQALAAILVLYRHVLQNSAVQLRKTVAPVELKGIAAMSFRTD
jgi:hypothetical protein